MGVEVNIRDVDTFKQLVRLLMIVLRDTKDKDTRDLNSEFEFELDWVCEQDDEIEVIGNVYDNPELLGGANNGY